MVTDCDGRLCDHVELPIRQKGKLSKPQRVPRAGASSFGIGFGRRPFHVTSAQVPLPTTMDRREDTGQRIERATSLIAPQHHSVVGASGRRPEKSMSLYGT